MSDLFLLVFRCSAMAIRRGHALVPENIAKLSTHSPNLYAVQSQWPRSLNLKALDLLEMAFQAEADDSQQFLDIGCGPGDFTREFLLPRLPRCRKIVATDLSLDMIQYAQQHFAHPKIYHDFLNIEGDVSQLAARHGEFRRVYSFFCLHWVRDLGTALRNISKLMSNEGECLLLFIARNPMFQLRREVVNLKKWQAYRQVRNASMDRLGIALTSFGRKMYS